MSDSLKINCPTCKNWVHLVYKGDIRAYCGNCGAKLPEVEKDLG